MASTEQAGLPPAPTGRSWNEQGPVIGVPAQQPDPGPGVHPIFGSPGGPQIYVSPEDVYESLPDGRLIQIAVKGKGYPLGDAHRLGLLPAPAPVEARSIAPEPVNVDAERHIGDAPVSATADAGLAPAGAERAPALVPQEAKPGVGPSETKEDSADSAAKKASKKADADAPADEAKSE